ncbi:hypothetical protein O6H91_23G023500 [Diphasiastrum complanatum]|uniref:Uncharacterized protein n=1 Tax=Diphasiastrum complanatum TaxID=34168 RepID=A0ACC2A8Z8_DIPCM|nr:hypothetical protein O6H91_23G023500 [Diphasiastrum complanatum]
MDVPELHDLLELKERILQLPSCLQEEIYNRLKNYCYSWNLDEAKAEATIIPMDYGAACNQYQRSVLAFFIALGLVKRLNVEMTYISSQRYYGRRVDVEWAVDEQDTLMVRATLPTKQICWISISKPCKQVPLKYLSSCRNLDKYGCINT